MPMSIMVSVSSGGNCRRTEYLSGLLGVGCSPRRLEHGDDDRFHDVARGGACDATRVYARAR